MKVYLVSDGHYSDYTVLGIYSTKEKAEEARALYAAEFLGEWETDKPPPHPPGELRWSVAVHDNGDVISVNQVLAGKKYVAFESHRKYWEPKNARILTLWAKDKNHAIKVASEKRREMLVSGEWYK